MHDEEPLGVLNVLDRRERSFSSVEEMDLLGKFASQAAIALSSCVPAGAPDAERSATAPWSPGLATTIDGLRVASAPRRRSTRLTG